MSPDSANEVLLGRPGLMISRAPAKLESVISQALAPFEEVYCTQITRNRLVVSTPISSHMVQLYHTIVHPSTGKVTQRGYGPILKVGKKAWGLGMQSRTTPCVDFGLAAIALAGYLVSSVGSCPLLLVRAVSFISYQFLVLV